MDMRCFLRVEGIEGLPEDGCWEGCIEIVKAEHNIYILTDRTNGTISGARAHIPLRYKCLCEATHKALMITWYRLHSNCFDEFHYIDFQYEQIKPG